MEFMPQLLPTGSRVDQVPEAPPGTIFVVGPEGGYAVPRCRYTLLFGRNRENVHVPVGVDDPTVSRQHGVFTCTGPNGEWWLHNTGQLPIELLDSALLLADHWRCLESGYTTLVIHSSKQRSHTLEVRVTGRGKNLRCAATTTAPTEGPETVYVLSPQERLVLTAHARRFLEGHDDCPLPLTWDETAQTASNSPFSARIWTKKTAANTVDDVRERLHREGVPRLLREEVGEPVGSTLSINLIRELIKTSTLTSQDLGLLGQAE